MTLVVRRAVRTALSARQETGKYSGLSPCVRERNLWRLPGISSSDICQSNGELQQRPCAGFTPNFHGLYPIFSSNCRRQSGIVTLRLRSGRLAPPFNVSIAPQKLFVNAQKSDSRNPNHSLTTPRFWCILMLIYWGSRVQFPRKSVTVTAGLPGFHMPLRVPKDMI